MRKLVRLLLTGLLVLSGGVGQVGAQSINGALGPPFQGTQTNNNAPAGYIGEEGSSVLLVGSAVALTTATTANVTSASLAAGDYEVSGEVWEVATTATATLAQGGLNTTSAALPTVPSDNTANVAVNPALTTATATLVLPVAPIRISLASTTSVFLVAQATFSAGTVSAYGKLRWRRVR